MQPVQHPELPHKLDVLRRHCDNEGRDYDEITKTVYQFMDIGDNGEKTEELIDQLGKLDELGFDLAIGAVPQLPRLDVLERIGTDVVPVVARF